MEIPNTEEWRFTDVRFLPIFKEYAKRINLVETIGSSWISVKHVSGFILYETFAIKSL